MFPDFPPRPHLVVDAAAAHDRLVAAGTAHLDAPTPCDGWAVRDLLAHLLAWTPVLADAGRGVSSTPRDLPVSGETPGVLATSRADLVAVWSDPAAWTEPTAVAGTDLPGSVVGTMVLCELVLHAWDLSRATGTAVTWSDGLLEETHDALERLTPLGRGMGAFGPAVDVPGDAPWIDRVVAVAGRDPRR